MQVAPWLVFGGMVRTVSMTGNEPGLNPFVTALEEEGFTDTMSTQFVESFARNFMRDLQFLAGERLRRRGKKLSGKDASGTGSSSRHR